jgi:hypothetical protein
MKAFKPLGSAWLYPISISLALLPGCGGGAKSSLTTIVPIQNCAIKQVNALKPPCPPGVDCTSSFTNAQWDSNFQAVLASSAVYGVNIYVPWSSVETSQQNYDFSSLDAQVSYYQQNSNKKVNLMWMAINYGNVNNSAGGVNNMTPSYVFTTSWASSLGVAPQDVAYCTNYPGSGSEAQGTYANASDSGFDPTGYPVVYETPFVTAYQNFISHVIQHYNPNPTIGYMRFGLSVGDEADPYCTSPGNLPNWSYPSTWETYVGTMDQYESSTGPSMQLMESLNAADGDPTTLPDFEAQTAAGYGLGFGSNGWESSDITALVSNTPCTSDWCAMFALYPKVPHELQTATPSDPSSSSATVGNLATLIQETAAKEDATILELALPDLYTGLQANYNASYYTQYNAAITDPCGAAAQ